MQKKKHILRRNVHSNGERLRRNLGLEEGNHNLSKLCVSLCQYLRLVLVGTNKSA